MASPTAPGFYLSAAFLLAIVGVGLVTTCRCQPLPEPVPPGPVYDASTDATIRTDCEVACAHLLGLGCAEGSSPTCASACDAMVRDRLVNPDLPACWTLAVDKPRARLCGSLVCQSTTPP